MAGDADLQARYMDHFSPVLQGWINRLV
jgi:hypothetical protein